MPYKAEQISCIRVGVCHWNDYNSLELCSPFAIQVVALLFASRLVKSAVCHRLRAKLCLYPCDHHMSFDACWLGQGEKKKERGEGDAAIDAIETDPETSTSFEFEFAVHLSTSLSKYPSPLSKLFSSRLPAGLCSNTSAPQQLPMILQLHV
jgi:hypothetical protein